MNDLTLLNLTLILFLIMNPIGNSATFQKVMNSVDPSRQKKVFMREMAIALGVMILFNYLGELIFTFLNLTEEAVRITAGVILFLVAIKILFPAMNYKKDIVMEGEPFIVPLAIPLIAGPSLLATIMLFAHLETCQPLILSAILIAWMLTSVVLIISPWLTKIMGKNGLGAAERLLAMILVMMAIQRIMEGIQIVAKH